MDPPASEGDATSDAGGQDDDDDKTPSDRPPVEAKADRYYQPGEREEDDQDADEFLADVLASAAVGGVIKGVNRNLARRNPPERAKPHPTTSRWAAEGLSYRLEKLMGRGKMGPNAKLALGFGGMILTMYMNAELIPVNERPVGERGSPRPPSSDARASGPASPTNGATAPPAASSAATSPDAPAAESKSLEPLRAAVGTFRRSN